MLSKNLKPQIPYLSNPHLSDINIMHVCLGLCEVSKPIKMVVVDYFISINI